MAQKNELDTLIKKIGKLHKKIRFVAIIHKNGKILKTEMRDEVPSLLKTKNEEKFCQDVSVRRKMREEFDKSLGKVRFVNVERENISQIVMYAKTKSLFVTVEPEISITDKTKIISQMHADSGKKLHFQTQNHPKWSGHLFSVRPRRKPFGPK